jgi:hypothetical protein
MNKGLEYMIEKWNNKKHTIFSWLQPPTRKLAKCIPNLQQQYVWEIVLLHLHRTTQVNVSVYLPDYKVH